VRRIYPADHAGIGARIVSISHVTDREAGNTAAQPADHGANHSNTGAGAEMITIPQLTAQALGSFLSRETEGRFGSSHSDLTKLLPFAARLTLECIGNSDALYHDIEHTMLVTLVGHDILVGRALARATTADDYANFIMACLAHDIKQPLKCLVVRLFDIIESFIAILIQVFYFVINRSEISAWLQFCIN